MELHRDRLTECIARTEPRLVLITAPAGFGKSTLARQASSSFKHTATLDVGARTQTDLGGCEALIVENADAARSPAAQRTLWDLLSKVPSQTTIFVCARRPLAHGAARVAPPHRVVSLKAGDLAFDREEIRRLLPPATVSEDALAAIERQTGGWPIAVLFARRLLEEGRAQTLVGHTDGEAFADLHRYLVDEILLSLSQAELNAILCCVAIEGATAHDVAAALGRADSDVILDRLLDASPFVTRSCEGVYDVHALLRAAARTRFARRCAKLASCAAAAHERAQHYLRAAQIYRQIGDLDATARVVCADNARPNRRQSSEFTSLVASLDQETLTRHRILRALGTYPKRFRVDPHRLREEAEAVWFSLPAQTDFETRCNVAGPLARIMYETGHFDDAERLLRSLESAVGCIPEIPRSSGETYVARTLACVLARSGRISEADGYFRKGYLVLPGAEMVESRYAIERAIIERLHGRRNEERRFADHAIELAIERNSPVHIACALAEAAFGAWFAGEDVLFQSYVVRLAERVAADGMRGFAHFCNAARPGALLETNGTEQPNWLACAYLVASAASEGETRAANAARAKEAADESNDVFLRVIAAVTLALVEPERRNELLLDALILAGRIEAPAAQAAVAALLAEDGETGILGPLVQRLHRLQRPAPTMLVEVLTRSVKRAGTTIELRERELALFLVLARKRRAHSRAEIVAALWPDLDEPGARDALNTCLYRLRQRLGEDAVIWSRDGGYRLRDDIRVDLREIEQWIGGLRCHGALQRHERTMLRRLYVRLRDARLEAGEQWEWLEPIVARIREMRQLAAERLANEALLRGEIGEALQIARDLLDDDPCDETACELAIKGHLAGGDHASAARQYRYFREVLRRQLDTEPSLELRGLALGRPLQAATA